MQSVSKSGLRGSSSMGKLVRPGGCSRKGVDSTVKATYQGRTHAHDTSQVPRSGHTHMTPARYLFQDTGKPLTPQNSSSTHVHHHLYVHP